MTNHAALNSDGRLPAPDVESRRGQSISAADELAFRLARERLSAALESAAGFRAGNDVAEARIHLRSLAVKLRDAGYWRTDKQGLRATVALLWQADRFVSDAALRSVDAHRSAQSGHGSK